MKCDTTKKKWQTCNLFQRFIAAWLLYLPPALTLKETLNFAHTVHLRTSHESHKKIKGLFFLSRLHFVNGRNCVLYEVQTGNLNITQKSFRLPSGAVPWLRRLVAGPLTAEARVWSHVSPCDFYGGHRDRFSPEYFCCFFRNTNGGSLRIFQKAMFYRKSGSI